MNQVLSRQVRKAMNRPWLPAETLLEQSELYRSRMSSAPSDFFSIDNEPDSPTSGPTSPVSPSTCPSTPRKRIDPEDDETKVEGRPLVGPRCCPEAWASEDLSATLRIEDLQPDSLAVQPTGSSDITTISTPIPATLGIEPETCSLASSAQAFMERKRQAEDEETSQQMEWQHFIRKKTSVTADSEEDEDGRPVTRTPTRASGAPLSIAEQYQLCNQVSKTLLVPITEVKACFDDFVNLDLDGSFTLSADEFEKAVRRSCQMTDGEVLPENLALKYAQMDSDGNRVVDFQEYVRWSQGASWSEQLLVRDDRDREARRLARVYGIHLLDVERLRRLFDSYATPQRVITQETFAQVIRGILKVSDPSDVPPRRLERYWREIDLDCSGTVDFEEFVIWMNDRGPRQSSFLTRQD